MRSFDYEVTRWRAVDGDTIDLDVRRTQPLAPGWSQTIESDRPYHVRLITVDTPERGHPLYRFATAQLAAWLQLYDGQLRVQTYEGAGWGRDLADVYVDGDRSNTATQQMLMLGWPVYEP